MTLERAQSDFKKRLEKHLSRQRVGNAKPATTVSALGPNGVDDRVGRVFKGVAGVILVLTVLVLARSLTSWVVGDAVTDAKSHALQYSFSGNDWKSFNSVEGGFTVLFPSHPTHTQHRIELPNTDVFGVTDVYIADGGDTAYIVQAIEYRGSIQYLDPLPTLEGALNGRLNELPNSELIASSFEDGRLGKELNFLAQSDGYLIQGKMMVTGLRLYDLEMVCKREECSPESLSKFIDSFDVLPSED